MTALEQLKEIAASDEKVSDVIVDLESYEELQNLPYREAVNHLSQQVGQVPANIPSIYRSRYTGLILKDGNIRIHVKTGDKK